MSISEYKLLASEATRIWPLILRQERSGKGRIFRQARTTGPFAIEPASFFLLWC
jgi:hypothetical protein